MRLLSRKPKVPVVPVIAIIVTNVLLGLLNSRRMRKLEARIGRPIRAGVRAAQAAAR